MQYQDHWYMVCANAAMKPTLEQLNSWLIETLMQPE